MKHFFMTASAIVFTSVVFGQTKITPDAASNYIDSTVTICGKVTGTHVSSGEKKVTSLNFGPAYPNQTFVAVIFEKNIANFKYEASTYLKDKNVCLTGKVVLYKGKPEIILENQDQIKEE